MALTYNSVNQIYYTCSTSVVQDVLNMFFHYFLRHLSVDPQNGVTHGIFSAGEDSSQVSEIHDVGSNT